MHPLQSVRPILINKSNIGVVINIHGSNIWTNNCTSNGTKMSLEFSMQVHHLIWEGAIFSGFYFVSLYVC